MSKSKEKNYITSEGHKVLVDELNMLLHVERPKLCELIHWAASLGDRSENADYIYGKKRLREIDSRIRFLSRRLEIAEIVESSQTSSDRIQFGATVEVIDEEGNKRSYRIVGVDESDPRQGKISWKSPIGAAMLGKMVGDEIIVSTPQGDLELTIERFAYS